MFNFSMHASSPGCQVLPFPAICDGRLRGAPLLSGLLITAYGHWEEAGLCAPGNWVAIPQGPSEFLSVQKGCARSSLGRPPDSDPQQTGG